ncbi:putative ABC-type dipeptide/oligopeptide/nickel transport systems, permease component [Vibrio nigripulchritudo MADA3029]|uniref:ABC-type dipeptide/oligopeptide/nickel transport systems, permease component n=2 Tax=Vibrio nigripulchritudo TaxID=28173 RepID=A0AAV2VM27_9VIBR|nr:ABC transporter permease [Vibrio nigripulchritudo]KJY76323.1 diguanylate cyclase [Vibrio nigripulchritudo]CCN32906.1 putative ABC-type dipeptide/oligopeptide/nickel transport systems, permease component [Vibrio nigripulchritudo AM115]CCN40407.1 putative ABC-type dipeptide/oligopeptide/nickel transport systems, permease component [Vibrio nigripulchritudo FTn2]CCN50084.1 putative ABC-type dipeptide/oligopeptide/nickel transport systems, permease component [Vibrio nigripulchritudo MADA3020]CCN
MKSFFISRILQMFLVLFLASFAAYNLMGLMPGDPIDLLAQSDPNITSEDIARLKAEQGLDKPVYVRYFVWLGDALQGDLGYSRMFSQPAIDVLWDAMKNTLVLVGSGTLLSIFIALPLGIICAVKQNKATDYIISGLTYLFLSTPAAWLALMLIMIFSVVYPIFPAGGTGEADGAEGLEKLQYMVLPILSLTLLSIASISRFMRSSMLEVFRQDFVRTAKAKGASSTRVLFKHCIKNGMLPMITVLAMDVAALMSGAVLTETIFSWPGIGKLTVDSINGSDYNVAMLCFMVATTAILVMNFIADILYSKVDPRIDLTKGGNK